MSLTHMCLHGAEEGMGLPAAATPGSCDLPDTGAGIELESFRKIASSPFALSLQPLTHVLIFLISWSCMSVRRLQEVHLEFSVNHAVDCTAFGPFLEHPQFLWWFYISLVFIVPCS